MRQAGAASILHRPAIYPTRSILNRCQDSLWRWLDPCYHHTLFDRYLLIGIAALLFLEWCLPAEPRQRLLSVGFAQDAVWFVLEGVLRVGLVVLFVDLLCRFMTNSSAS